MIKLIPGKLYKLKSVWSYYFKGAPALDRANGIALNSYTTLPSGVYMFLETFDQKVTSDSGATTGYKNYVFLGPDSAIYWNGFADNKDLIYLAETFEEAPC